ncbi:MAG: dihydroorotase [Thomasclavelia sp.]|nr:dihydroorotase [Thomasclavelia sp.]
MKTLLKNGNVFYHNEVIKTNVLIENDTIINISNSNLDADKVIDLDGKLLVPGLVDLHEHLREPGFEHKGTIKTETLSAKYGGYTHIVAMANTNPCMDDVETIRDFVKRVQKDSAIHTYTYSAITTNLAGKEVVDMENIIKEPIVKGFSDDGKGLQDPSLMENAMSRASKLGSIIVAHEEDENELVKGGCVNLCEASKEAGLVGINNASEYNHAKRDLKLALKTGSRFHICHMSTKETVAALKEARKESKDVSGEACVHHLILTDENIKTLNPNYKMNPPLRSKDDLKALIDGLNNGVVTCISTDHAPHSKEEKQKPIDKAPFGIIGNEQAFPLMYTYLVKKGLISLETVIRCMSISPAKIIHLKHDLDIGYKANMAVFDLNEEFIVEEDKLHSKASNTPFIGTKCFGKIKYIILDGKVEKL